MRHARVKADNALSISWHINAEMKVIPANGFSTNGFISNWKQLLNCVRDSLSWKEEKINFRTNRCDVSR